MTESITRCPKCKTSFRVSADHLKTARGAVRCGSCLNIFNAKAYLISEEPEVKQDLAESENKSSETHEDILISDDMPLEEDDSDDIQPLEANSLETNMFIAKTASKQEINLFERRIKDAERQDRDHSEADESWALSLLEEDKHEDLSATQSFKLSIENKENGDDGDTRSQNKKNKKERDSEPEVKDDESDEPFSPIFQVIEEDYEKRERGLEPFPDPLIENVDQADGLDSYEVDIDDDFEQTGSGYNSPSSTGFFESFEPEPVEMHVRNKSKFLYSPIFWIPVNIFALMLLFSQIAYFKFDDWGRQKQFRPYYAKACSTFGCKLPILQDLNKIKIDSMVVIDHPEKADMLLVDATILNRAKFEQYFPTLTMTFTDIGNNLVSKLAFKPQDYVGGELAGKKLMPARQPIHITLEIDDPGQDAVNYQISIVKP